MLSKCESVAASGNRACSRIVFEHALVLMDVLGVAARKVAACAITIGQLVTMLLVQKITTVCQAVQDALTDMHFQALHAQTAVRAQPKLN